MRINLENKSVDIEVRDINYILPAYIRSYLFYAKNESPERIIFPMFPSVPHPTDPKIMIPIEYVPMDSPVAVEVTQDGSNIPEATEEQIRAIDEKDEEIKKLQAEVEGLKAATGITTEEVTPAPEDLIRQQHEAEINDVGELTPSEAAAEEPPVSPAKAAFASEEPKPPTVPIPPDREPNKPDVVIPPGSPLDGMAPRDRRDQSRVARDLIQEPDIDESKEKPFEKEIERDEEGKPIVKDKDSSSGQEAS